MKNLELSSIKDENIESLINDEIFIEMWKNELTKEEQVTSALLKIVIKNKQNEKLIYTVHLDFKKKQGYIICKEVIKKVP